MSNEKAILNETSSSLLSRRAMFQTGAVFTASVIASGTVAPKTANANSSNNTRATQARDLIIEAANNHFDDTIRKPTQRENGDAQRYATERYYASFSKTLPHNNFGEVRPDAFVALRNAINSENSADFEQVPLSPNADRSLANPQGSFRFVMCGLDGHATRMPPAPTFRSAITAGEMGELYWLALTRDIPFNLYNGHPLIDAALDDLNEFTFAPGAKENGKVTANTLFRGQTPGDLVGPYISQFLLKDVPYGPSTIVQSYPNPDNVDFMTDIPEWLAILRGVGPSQATNFKNGTRYIYNNRTLGEYVHNDVLFQAYFNAMLIALSFGSGAIDGGNPYLTTANQGGFTSLGAPWMIDMLTQAGNLALAGAWCQKWIHHMRLRPEVYSGRIHFELKGQRNYEINREILDSSALDRIGRIHGSYLLPMAYPEGSPTHPAYPAGHACVAGACATVLKAVFDEDFVIPNPVKPNDNGTALQSINENLTLRDEFNKLAANISLGRDAAGVHYRSDGINGIKTGEQQAIALMEDYSMALNENFGGFSLTKFDGTRILIIDGKTIKL